MRRLPEPAVYVATFGSMTAAAAVVIAVIILDSGGDSGDRDGGGFTVRAVVAAQHISAGTEISEDMVKVVEAPDHLVVARAYRDTTPVVGQMTRVPIAEGDQLTPSKLGPAVSRTGGPICCGGLPTGRRAVTLEIEPVTTEGELVLPGDSVDIVIEDEGAGLADQVVENVEVLAVGSSGRVTPEGSVEESQSREGNNRRA